MKKFIFITLLVLLVGLFIFHFIGANQAESNIDKAIQEQVEASPASLSVQYSSIDISPFSGDIQFSDITIVEGSDIERSRKMNVDLRYLDFLNIYLGGIEYGLKNITAGDIALSKTSYLNRQSLQEYSIDTLSIEYSGNMWDAVQSIFTKRPTAFSHTVNMSGAGGRYNKPNSLVGTFTADSAFSRFEIPEGSTQWRKDGSHQFTFKEIDWNPPASFQNKYGFFIQGFGFKIDAVPIQEFGASYQMVSDSQIMISEGIASTELFNANFEGSISADSTWANTEYDPLNVSIIDFSTDFTNFLTNLEELLGIELPGLTNGKEIQFQLVGPVEEPSFQ